jgi:uncharacterized protein YndB with AHSA1/START domain
MTENEKFELEYSFPISQKLLYNMISSPEGLAKWFANKVDITGKNVTFTWKDSEQHAEIISHRTNEWVRYRWLEVDDSAFFEFKILTDELTGDLTLLITDFAHKDEKEDAIFLWEDNIKKLKRAIGV